MKSQTRTYQWNNPGEWLEHHIDRLRDSGSDLVRLDLASLARTLGRELDSDQIQDLFQDQMEEDGYFRPQPSAIRHHIAKRRGA